QRPPAASPARPPRPRTATRTSCPPSLPLGKVITHHHVGISPRHGTQGHPNPPALGGDSHLHIPLVLIHRAVLIDDNATTRLHLQRRTPRRLHPRHVRSRLRIQVRLKRTPPLLGAALAGGQVTKERS